MTEFDPEEAVEPQDNQGEETTEEAPEQSSNRTFILVALGLGGLFIIGLICIAIVALVIVPGQSGSRNQTATAIAQNNADVRTQAFLQANPATATPLPTDTEVPSDTPPPALVQPSDTPVIALNPVTDTPLPTDTAGPSPTPSRTPTRISGLVGTAVGGTGTAIASIGGGASGTLTGTPTRISFGGGTATKTATPTALGGGGEGLTRTPTPTALPDTGFADNVGGPGLFIAAVLLVVVLFFARQLRLRNS
jgi:hypothetical protein